MRSGNLSKQIVFQYIYDLLSYILKLLSAITYAITTIATIGHKGDPSFE